MGQQKLRKAKPSRGKDEMNLAEFPLTVIGKRAPGNVKTLHFEDEVWDRAKQAYVPRKLTITGSDLLGLPTSLDDEVLLGCVQLTKEAGFENREVRFTRYELMERIGWNKDGRSYNRISESLDRWAGTLVISDKAFWDKAGQCWVKDSFNILDRVVLSDFEGEGEPGWKRSAFIWGDFMWKSFQAGNLKELDFDFWLSLKSPVAKRLYRLLDKRFYNRETVTFDLHRLAWDKVGLSRKMHTGQIKEKLKPAHEELNERGVCQTKYVRQGRGKWEVVYGNLQNGAELSDGKGAQKQIVTALKERGVRNGRELVLKYPTDRILAAMENFDDRIEHGEELGPGWLGKAIVQNEGFAFRKGYQSEEAKAAKRAEKQELAEAEKKRVAAEKLAEKEAAKLQVAKRKTFAKRIDTYSPAELEELETEAIKLAEADGKRVIADLVRKARRNGEPVAKAGAIRQQLWQQYVFGEKF